jgi:hypothetical protein
MELYLHSLISLMACTGTTLPSFSMFMITVILSKVLFAAMAHHSDCVIHPLHRSKHPQISAFHPPKLKFVLLYVYCYGLIKCRKVVFIKV